MSRNVHAINLTNVARRTSESANRNVCLMAADEIDRLTTNTPSSLADAADRLLSAYLLAHPDKMPSTLLVLDLIAWGKTTGGAGR